MKNLILPLGALLILALPLLLSAQTPPEPGRWAFEPARDQFRSDALLDLRSMNEKTAGQSGFVRAGSDGQFVRGDGKPLRFWSVFCNIDRAKPFIPKPLGSKNEADLAHAARFLAKRGVNMVRIGFDIGPDLAKQPDAPASAIDEPTRDWYWRVVAAMKKEGIYTTLCPYWSVPVTTGKNWKIPGGDNQPAIGLLFFDPTLQAAYKAWMKALYTEKNPYTGIPLAKEPAVGIIQIQNEDSLLFWTFNSIKGEQRKNLGRLFAQWTTQKYGSLQAAIAAWGGKTIEGDSIPESVLEFVNIYELTLPRTDNPHSIRIDDQTQFLTETDHAFYKMMDDYLKHDLGCEQLINPTNWRTASPLYLQDAERWSYSANDVDALNRYYGGIHTGPNYTWAIKNGDQFTSPSILLDPTPLPVNLKRVVGRPIIVPESCWMLPGEYLSEGPLLVSAYSSLSGVASYYWFTTDDDEWTQPQSANGYDQSQRLWTFAHPDLLGTFPAAALLFRMGYVQQGEPVVQEERSLDDLWKRRPPVISEEGAFDPVRDTGNLAPALPEKTAVDPLAFLCGPVLVHYGGDASLTHVAKLDTLIDHKSKTVRSNTGQLTLNYDKGVCTVNASKAQGVAAFFKNQRTVTLADVEFTSENDYATAIVVPLDDRPISESSNLLVQVGTQSHPTGWKQSPLQIKVSEGTFAGYRVDDIGHAPWQVICPKLRVTIHNPLLSRATALDMNGQATMELPISRTGDTLNFEFPKNAMYVVVRRMP